MSEQTDPDFLANEAYSGAAALSLRIRLQERYRTHPQNWFHWIFERLFGPPKGPLFEPLTLPAQGRVLELGAGPGDLWLENIPRLGGRLIQPLQLTLSDLSTGMLQDARRRLVAAGLVEDGRLLASLLAVDAEAIPFPAQSFAVVLGLGLLDHLPHRSRGLDEIRRVLQPGGRFCTTAGGRTHLQELETLVRPFLPEADYGGDPDRFGLENGAAVLAPWFKDIRLEEYHDELVFDRPEPVVAYALSEAAVRQALDEPQRRAFRQFVEAELAVRGELRVTSVKGLFICQRLPT